ncbi:hypothetical protein QL285_057149 [Trifolium repens]|nr:hypothetical protein QL285_057149 [Trifolium repens]
MILWESLIEKIGHERGSKEEVIAETFECNMEKTSYHELRRKEEDTIEILESIIKKTDHEWGSIEEDIAEIKKILLEQINASKENKEDIAEIKKILLEQINASKENKNDTNQELIPASEIKLLNFISNIKPCIIGIGKGLLKVLACLARHATKVIKICMQLFIGLVKTLVTMASLVMKIIVWLFTGIVKEVILFFKFFLGVAR